MKLTKIIGLFYLLFSIGCSDFLDEYSQTYIRASKISDYDELLLGAVYIPSLTPVPPTYYVYPSGSNVCDFLNVLDDDSNVTTEAEINRAGGDKPINEWVAMHNVLFGYTTWQQFITNTELTEHNDQTTWVQLYQRIVIINSTLAEIDDIDVKTDEEVADYYRVKGEYLFLRGQFYLLLANLYGKPYDPETASSDLGVPLKITAGVEHDKDKDTQFERTSLDRIYAQIVDDLKASLEAFGHSSKHVLYRASEEAARLLLSRVYLYMQEYEEAKTVLEPIFSNITLSSLVSGDTLGGNNRFLTEENSEMIFSQGSQFSEVCWTANAPDFCVSRDLYDLYDENDRRKGCFTLNTGTDSIALSYKYNTGNYRARVSDVLSMRAAEAWLNMAEACAMIGGASEGTANEYLNTLRRNRIVGYADRSYSGEELVNQIRLERRKELCFEGHRWFDLRRYSVCKKYPYSKKIYRSFSFYTSTYALERIETYVLEENDPAYVFAIPRTVLEFDTEPMPDNERPERIPLESAD